MPKPRFHGNSYGLLPDSPSHDDDNEHGEQLLTLDQCSNPTKMTASDWRSSLTAAERYDNIYRL